MLNQKIKIVGLFLTLVLVLFSGCASRNEKVFQDEGEGEDLVKEFNLEKVGFKEFEEKEAPLEATPKPVSRKKKKEKHRKLVAKKMPQKRELPTVVAKPVKIYPDNFPENLKKIDERSKPLWSSFTPKIYPGEEFVFEVSYMGITAGHVKLKTLENVFLGDKEVYKLSARMKSAKFYEYFYTLDDGLETLVDLETFRPLKYSLRQRESVQTVDDLQIFDHEKLRTFFWYKRIKRGVHKKIEKNVPIPKYFQDSYSALYFVRGFPLNIGDKYEFPVVTRGKFWMLKLKVIGVDEIKVGGQVEKAIKIAAETHFPGVLKKRGDIIFWYSADELKRLLKFEAKVKIGTVKGELVGYKQGKIGRARPYKPGHLLDLSK